MPTATSAFSSSLYVTGVGTEVITTILLSDGNILVYYPVTTRNNEITYAYRKLPPIPTDIASIPLL